ncbi:glyoxalase/bleomycin resistance protein/dioxygenase [Kalymmatonema gypsitolerans NIES-4073]|uniref:VOC family protein n=1 Tax=Scytonema sp. PCC 10023 TaxID=1680591 RepID=UPI000B5EB5C5|nr:glyoxalase/bleomycin resistance protein/dioxygenase [Scytonema sp. NIES-4073]
MELATVVVYVDDGAVPAALEFYERALGLTRRFYDPDYQFGELAGRGTVTLAVAAHVTGERLMPAGYERPSLGTRVANAEVAFTTDNVRGAFTRAVAAGAKVLAEPYVLPWGQEVAYVRAPDGTLLGLCAPLPGPGTPQSTPAPSVR